jgi:hypothetical protein
VHAIAAEPLFFSCFEWKQKSIIEEKSMKTIYLAALAGLVLATAAEAQPVSMDTDGDGAISRAEWDSAQAERFARLDADADGSLTREELRAGMGNVRDGMRGRMRERAAAVDLDGDGAWSLAELQAVRPGLTQEQFERLDRNGDGLISADERPRGRQGGGPG